MTDALARRVTILRESSPRTDARFVLYWMQHSQRERDNPALERAAAWANELRLPLKVLFVVDTGYPDANARHFAFMLQGIAVTADLIGRRGAHFSLRIGRPEDIVPMVARDAALLVTDRAYLKHPLSWRKRIADAIAIPMEMVEGDIVVPVDVASQKLETAARTFRPRVSRQLEAWSEPTPKVRLKIKAPDLGEPDDVPRERYLALAAEPPIDQTVGPIDHSPGGEVHARNRLAAFLKDDLALYGSDRADFVDRHVSMMSPYLHFGQISPLTILLAIREADVPDGTATYLEELIVRRELAINYVRHCPDYDSYKGLPRWSQESLALHAKDKRENIYTAEQLEAGETDDPYWNAAMREMRVRGYLHNHLRMYWGKRILGWMQSPEEAYAVTMHLNNKHFLDGRDANSYTNVSWVYGLHDRGWPERPVYGKVRIMTPSGLKRKFDIDAYVRWADRL